MGPPSKPEGGATVSLLCHPCSRSPAPPGEGLFEAFCAWSVEVAYGGAEVQGSLSRDNSRQARVQVVVVGAKCKI